MGQVYLAKSRSSGSRFAVKRMLLYDEKHRHNFLSELQTWLDLPKFPYLVACHFFRSVGDEVIIFAEYVKEGSLKEDWIDTRRLYEGGPERALERILDIAIQSAWGLHQIHEQKLVHQDVKPGNILIDSDGVTKVTDFGLARARARAGESARGSKESHLVSWGGKTPAYCSPEQFKDSRLSSKTDAWSWGVAVLEMFTGEVTWMFGPAASEVLKEYKRDGAREHYLPEMPEELVELLQEGCFRQDPDERWDMLKIAKVLVDIYKGCTRENYPHTTPYFLRPPDRDWPPHDRRVTTGARWSDPRDLLAEALKAEDRDPAEAQWLFPATTGSRQSQAVLDLRIYDEVKRIYERLVVGGRRDLEFLLTQICVNKALVHGHLGDTPGAIQEYDQAIGIYEPLVKREGRRELANELALCYMNRGNALWSLGKIEGAIQEYDRAIEIRERLVRKEGRGELVGDLAWVQVARAGALTELGEQKRASVEMRQAIATLEEEVQRTGRADLKKILEGARSLKDQCGL